MRRASVATSWSENTPFNVRLSNRCFSVFNRSSSIAAFANISSIGDRSGGSSALSIREPNTVGCRNISEMSALSE
jgi:hypothetical protein